MERRRLSRREPRRRGKADPQQGWSLLQKALRRLRILDEVEARRALVAFSKACGPRLSAHARAERFSKGTLYVRVPSSSWASEISFVAAELLSKVQSLPGGERVRAFRFTVGPLENLPDPAIDLAPKEPPRPRPVRPDEKVGVAMADVADTELRDALGALYLRACRAGRGGR